MKNLTYILLLISASAVVSSCIKGPSVSEQQTSTTKSLLNGKWLTIVEHIKVSDLPTLVKDTTIKYISNNSSALTPYYINFKLDGTGYYTTLPYTKTGLNGTFTDTTSFFKYTINDKVINFTKPDGTPIESDLLVQLGGYTLETLTNYVSTPPAGWGLNATKTYNFVQDITYSKQ